MQRIAPTHYMASWVDLPQNSVDLRYVPEIIVATLADQAGEAVQSSEKGKRTRFPVGKNYAENILLQAFSQGVTRRGNVVADRASDQFDEENTDVGLDQLLTIRLAGSLKSAPVAAKGAAAGISNQRPLAKQAAGNFADDMRRFLRGYATELPRHALVDMLESCIAIGMTTVLSSLAEMLLRWVEAGELPDYNSQHPIGVLVDCSNGVDLPIRACAEQSMDDFMRRMERLPHILMALRLLDYHAKHSRKIKRELPASRPYATDRLNLLGEFLHQRHQDSDRIHNLVEEKAELLADEDEIRKHYPEVASILENEQGQPNAVWRLARGLTVLMGESSAIKKLSAFIDSSLLTERPNGLAAKRKATREGRRRDVRRFLLSNTAIEYLVHLHLLKSSNRSGTRKLSLDGFIELLRERYGFYIDVSPPGMSISNEILRRNRSLLERRLRDLGLLVGVNDAEAMKYLRPRFEPVTGN